MGASSLTVTLKPKWCFALSSAVCLDGHIAVRFMMGSLLRSMPRFIQGILRAYALLNLMCTVHTALGFLSCASQLVSPPVWSHLPLPSSLSCRQKPGGHFSFPVSLDIPDPTTKTSASACSTFVSRGKKLHFPPQELALGIL